MNFLGGGIGRIFPLNQQSQAQAKRRRFGRSAWLIRIRRAVRELGWVSVLLVCLILFYAELKQMGAEISPDGVKAPFQFQLCQSGHLKTCIVDGDSFRLGGAEIRIADFDAPEIAGSCASEAKLAARATRRLQQLLSQHNISLVRTGPDVDEYGRKPRIVMHQGRSVGQIMIAEGLGRPFEQRFDSWCD